MIPEIGRKKGVVLLGFFDKVGGNIPFHILADVRAQKCKGVLEVVGWSNILTKALVLGLLFKATTISLVFEALRWSLFLLHQSTAQFSRLETDASLKPVS